jgi:hypothetical protein
LLTPVIYVSLPNTEHPMLDGMREKSICSRRQAKSFLTLFVIALGSCLTILATSHSIKSAVTACCFLLCQAAIFVILIKDRHVEDEQLGSILLFFGKVSYRVLIILTVFLVITPQRTPFASNTSTLAQLVMIALPQSVFWVALVVLVRFSAGSPLNQLKNHAEPKRPS